LLLSFLQYHAGNNLGAVRCGQYKLFFGPGGENATAKQLYDLHADVSEAKPIAQSSSVYRAQVGDLEQLQSHSQ
jgi:hypothetical protein